MNMITMNTTNRQTTADPRELIAAVRKMIEREFFCLQAQQPRVLELALNEAEALAWQTGLGHLLFPELAREKASAVAAWHVRQESIRRTEPIQSFAA
jgi:hypothetical protein